MSSGLSTLGRSASKRVCSFRRIILAARTSGPRTKSASIFSRLKFTAGIHGATLRRLTSAVCIRLIYSTVDGCWCKWWELKNGGKKSSGRVGFHDRAEQPNVNEFPRILAYIPKDFHHPLVCSALVIAKQRPCCSLAFSY